MFTSSTENNSQLLEGLTNHEISKGPKKSSLKLIIGFMLIIASKSQMFLLLGEHSCDYFEKLSGDKNYLEKHVQAEKYIKILLLIPISLLLEKNKGILSSLFIIGFTSIYLVSIPILLYYPSPIINYTIAFLRALCYSSVIFYPAVRVRESLAPKMKNIGSGIIVVHVQVISFFCYSFGNFIYPIIQKRKNFNLALICSFFILTLLAIIGGYLIHAFEKEKIEIDLERIKEIRLKRSLLDLDESDSEDCKQKPDDYILSENMTSTVDFTLIYYIQ